MIPLSDVAIGELEQGYVAAAMAERWISGTGPFVTRFETELAEIAGRAHAIAVTNGTLAIELALRGLGVGAGDEIIVPALTFAAPAMSVVAIGATPVIVDVCPRTWTLAPEAVEPVLTDRTKGIIAVDVLGHPADYDALTGWGIPVIEDAAQSHGAKYKGRPTGSLGTASVFSFHANKTVTTGEGGAVCIDDPGLAAYLRTMANHGMRPHRPYHHEILGRNFRMTNLTAAIGVGQLQRWQELVAARRRVADRYASALDGVPCAPRPVASWAEWSCWLYSITVEAAGLADGVVRHLRERGVDARHLWPALTEQPALGEWRTSCPIAEDVARRTIKLPTHARMSDADIDQVATTVREALKVGADG